MFPWDSGFGDFWAGQADRIELGAYVGVIIVAAVAITRVGINAHGVPWAVVAVLAVVVAARGLFELGVLYGGADAKALMISGLLVPVLSTPLVFTPPHAPSALSYLPFPVSLLTNAALFSIAVPLGLAIHNARRREFSFSKGFMGYSLAVEELPNRFVWVKDPAVPFDPSTDDAETSADDARERRRIARDLKARGIRRVWVTPQVPFLAVMAAGAVAAVLAGNLLLDAFLWI
jgi:preflagellin peptidase FlaK